MQGQVDPHLPALREALAHQKASRMQQAEAGYRAVLQAAPKHAMALHLLGVVLSQSGRALEGIPHLRRSVALNPRDPLALYNLAITLVHAGQLEDGLWASEKALALNPAYAQAHAARGIALRVLRRYEEAAVALETALRLAPDHAAALDTLLLVNIWTCSWNDPRFSVRMVEDKVRQGAWRISPFAFLCCSDSPDLQLLSARQHMESIAPARPPLKTAVHAGSKIRIAYVSGDFHSHATSYLLTELLELHDRSRFEVLGMSFGPQENSLLRTRIENACDRFFSVERLTDPEIADLLVREHVDIAIDLKGFTQGCRPGIFQFKPAPVIVNYLGYPGTMGAACYDYIIGDPVVTPFQHAADYAEKIVQLPNSYQVNDRQREVAPAPSSRQHEGLPATGFVFACFNASYKITPAVYDIWMRLMLQVEGSVLWLLADNPVAMQNLRREAEQRGVASSRIVFAVRLRVPEHLARQRIADLFLDTLPVNAHTTASDALWIGLPVLTCVGRGFAARVAASLLTAVGLPELVTFSLEAYEAMALRLASDPQRLQQIRQKLLAQRDQAPLFDTPLFAAKLEQAYVQMHERQRQGFAPAPMTIA